MLPGEPRSLEPWSRVAGNLCLPLSLHGRGPPSMLGTVTFGLDTFVAILCPLKPVTTDTLSSCFFIVWTKILLLHPTKPNIHSIPPATRKLTNSRRHKVLIQHGPSIVAMKPLIPTLPHPNTYSFVPSSQRHSSETGPGEATMFALEFSQPFPFPMLPPLPHFPFPVP